MGSDTLVEADPDRFANALSALSSVLQLLKSDVLNGTNDAPAVPSRDQIDEAMEILYQSNYLPYLWRTLFEQEAYLRRLQPMLDNLADASGCRADFTPERAEVLHNVFNTFFIEQVQPQLASFTKQGAAANESLRELNTEINSPKLTAYLEELTGISERLNQATTAHVQSWQDFFAACDLTVGE